MNELSGNVRFKSRDGKLEKPERIPSLRLVRALVLALILLFPGPSHTQMVPFSVHVVFQVEIVTPGGVSGFMRLCTGQSVDIEIQVVVMNYLPGEVTVPLPTAVADVEVVGTIGDNDVGEFVPPDARGPVPVLRTTRAFMDAQARALYTFVAKAPGRTTIEFAITDIGSEQHPTYGYTTNSGSIEVVVSDCFEAYTSGLGMVFTVKDMKDLMHPFTLEGYSAPNAGNGVSVTTSSQSFFFMPSGNPQNQFLPSFDGLYVFAISEVITAGNRQSECVNIANGRYEVEFHISPDDPLYRSGVDVGNLLLFGTASQYCEGRHVQTVRYAEKPGFQVAFKPTQRR